MEAYGIKIDDLVENWVRIDGLRRKKEIDQNERY
jgi:hypothetical protein